MKQNTGAEPRQQIITGSNGPATITLNPTNGGCKPKSGNWRKQNVNFRALDASSTRLFYTITICLLFKPLLNQCVFYI